MSCSSLTQQMRHRKTARLRARIVGQGGFSIVELMVAVLIAALLAAVAYPSYRDQVRKGRRSDAIAALGALQLAQERYRNTSVRYADSVALLGMAAASEGGHYALSIQNASATSYTVLATAKASSSQAEDTNCVRMAIAFSAGLTQYQAGGASGELAADTTRRCWPQ